MLSASGNGAVELYHDNAKKLETTAYGIDVTGTTDTDGLVVSGITTFSNATTIVNGGYHRGIINSGAQAKIIGGYISGSDTLRLGESMYLTTTGLGINESNPGHRLTIGGDGYFGFTTPNDAARQIIFNANRGSAGQTLANINWQWNSKNVAQIRGIAGSDTTNKDDGHLAFFTSAVNSLVERLRIDSSGRIGVGVVPTAQFNHNLIQIGNQATLGANAALSVTGQTFLTHNLYFDPSGNYQVFNTSNANEGTILRMFCLLYTSPSPRDGLLSRMPSSA